MARTILSAIVPSNSPLQTRPTRDAEYRRNLLQHRIAAQIVKMDSFIDFCLRLVDRNVLAMILGALLLLCGRGFSQSIDCEKLTTWHEVCKFSDGSVSETFSGDSYSRFEWTGAEAKKVWSKALAHRTAERRRLEREIKELQDKASVENNTIIPKTKGGSLKETTQRMCENAVTANKPLPSYCEPK